LRRIINYFLKNDNYSFIDGLTTLDELGSGYNLELHAPDVDYQTFLSNEYLDKNTTQEIIAVLEINVKGYIE
jgi:hypothetical protein